MTQDNERNGFIRAKNGNIPNDDEKAEEENLLKPTDEVAAIQTNKKEYFKKSLKEEPDDDPAPSISYFTLFRYATKKDRILIVLALISTTIAGCVTPFNTIVFANVLNAMVAYGSTVGIDPNAADTFMQEVQWFFIWNAIFGVILLVFVYIATVLMNQTAYNQVFIIRQEYLQAALNQDNSWYDLHESGDFASKMTEDLVKLEEGINEKVASFLYYMAAFLSSVIMAFVKGWKLALVCLCSFPVTLILVGSIAMVASKLAKQEAEAYGRAASVAEEVLSAVRTVYAFSGQQKEEQRFLDNLSDAKRINIKRSFFSACMMGILFFCIYASYALSFWYGVRLLQDPSENYDPSTMMAVFFGVMMGSMNFGMSTPLMEVFGVARGAGAQIFRLIDNVPIINPLLDLGARPAAVEGNLRLNNVHFTYPSRPDVPVLKGVDLTVKRGQTVALVGASGCGKSTIVQLLSRFYDPAEGSIQLDENDLRDLSVGWLRSQIGLVGQEPVLFNTTISENIRYGREDATPQQVEAAARAANAHHFIAKLPQGYNTLVGDKGTQLSGGQKQRIAIARALVRNPTILLLDEATSALDNTSEAIVQAALDKARQGRTTVIVAHRLSTIRSADVIYVFKDGRVVESGTHGDLMARRAFYYDMVALQTAPADLPALEPGHQPLDRQESTISKLSEASEIVPEEPMAAGEQDKDEEGREVTFLEVLGYSRPELITNTLACLCSLAVGFGMPLFAILFGDFVGNLSSGDPAVVAAQTNTLSLMFVGLGTAIGLTTFFQTFLFGVAGEKLTERMRHLMFGALLRQEVGFYDDKRNSTGALCAKLSGDASLVQGATGMRIGTVLQGVGSLGLGTAIGLYYEWRVGLVVLAISPLIVVLAYQSIRMSQQQAVGTSKTMEDSTKLAVDVVSNVRTVASLGRQRVFVEEFRAQLAPGLALSRRGTHIRGVVYAASRAMMNFTFAIAMYYGGYLVVNDGVEYADILKTTQALIMSTSSIGNMFAFAPNFDKGIRAAARIINLLERVPKILDPIKPEKEIFNASGDAALVDVHFSYPTRPTVQVLRGLGLDVRRGATVALVGASGCGKSTVIQLLQRFYEPSAGTVYLDGVALRALRVSEARRGIGLVQQEPVLFDRTIGENIAYGDNTRAPTAHEIVQAARDANIHNFIASLPLGYETRLGSKGTQLSGGQKQRIAIARALIRNPKILLLDEATSALDAESEKVVQEALDAAKEGRTCITIAHRLTTIQDADVICVLHQGRVGEIGTHSQLIAKRSLYYKLYQSSYS